MKARRWDEIMRIASTQVVVTAKVETVDGQVISIRQSTERVCHKSVTHPFFVFFCIF